MLRSRSSDVAELSPSQWAAWAPEPANVERDKTNGRFPCQDASTLLVAMDSVNPNKKKEEKMSTDFCLWLITCIMMVISWLSLSLFH